jgi:hypothetical protein
MTVIWKDGAQGRSRTTDTAIFSRMLYQLSYLGAPWWAAALIGWPGASVQLARTPYNKRKTRQSEGGAPTGPL